MDYRELPPPEPYQEKWHKDSKWKKEYWDKHLPTKGWITDFVAATRGIETPTNFCTWSALYLLSSLVKRDAWLKWFPGVIYLNLYILLVAPPRICAKSTAINLAEKFIYRPALARITDPILKVKKELNILHSRATMEALYVALQPVDGSIILKQGNLNIHHPIPLGSKLALNISEFSTFLGKQQYNTGLVDKLVDWYDCKDEDDSRTKSAGISDLKDIYVTMIGGTTFDGLKLSIPPEALKGGFISRLIIIINRTSKRMFPFPIEIPEAPTFSDLCDRLVWIVSNSSGEYSFAEDAKEAYEKWYVEFHERLNTGYYGDMDRSRLDINVLKVATLLRINRYERGNIITLQDFIDAVKLVEADVDVQDNPLADIGTTTYEKIHKAVMAKVAREGRCTFRDVLRSVSPEKKGGNSNHVREAIEQLWGEGRIKAFSGNAGIGNELVRLQFSSNEVYEWIGDE